MVVLLYDNLNFSVTHIIETGGQPSLGFVAACTTQPIDPHRSWVIE